MATDASPLVIDSALAAAISALVLEGASWGAVKEFNDGKLVHTLSNIRYAEDSPRQSLDIYFPGELLSSSPCLCKLPVYIHIHGGGWSRGDKASPFYGGPAMSQNAAASGCIAVAPGYRLGTYPEFMHDAARTIQWVRDNIESLGGDLSNVFLSGHSAGGHIASLLVLRHSCFLAPLDIPVGFFRGLILVSGVYDLFSPLRKAPVDSKNKWFVLAYVIPAFGTDNQLRREASPLLLLEPNKETSTLGSVATSITESFREYWYGEAEVAEAHPETVDVEINTSCLPSTLIFNATFDMGLQENGELMAEAMKKHTDVKYVLVSGTDHASICWNETTASEVSGFVNAHKVQTEKKGDDEF